MQHSDPHHRKSTPGFVLIGIVFLWGIVRAWDIPWMMFMAGLVFGYVTSLCDSVYQKAEWSLTQWMRWLLYYRWKA